MAGMTHEDAWRTLGVEQGADADQVAAAYRRAAKKAHPDAGGDAAGWQQLAEAYAMLAAGAPFVAAPEAIAPQPSRWRRLRRPPRVAIVALVAGVVIGAACLALFRVPDVPRAIPAVLSVYGALWWVYLVGREVRRRQVHPLRWYLRKVPSDRAGQEAFAERLRQASEPSAD